MVTAIRQIIYRVYSLSLSKKAGVSDLNCKKL